MNFHELLTSLTIHYNGIIRSVSSKVDLTSSQAFSLISIPFGGIPMSQLSHRLGLETSTLTRNIQKLEKMKLVVRKTHSYDKRIQLVCLTKKGSDKLEKIEESLDKINFSILNKINLDDQEHLIDSLEKINWSLDCIHYE